MATNYEHLREVQLTKIRNTFYNIISIDKQEGYTKVDIVTSWSLKELRMIIDDNNINYECVIYNDDVTTFEL